MNMSLVHNSKIEKSAPRKCITWAQNTRDVIELLGPCKTLREQRLLSFVQG